MHTDNPSSPTKVNTSSSVSSNQSTDKPQGTPTKNFREVLGAESQIPDAADEAVASPSNVFAALIGAGKEKKDFKSLKSDLGTELVADTEVPAGISKELNLDNKLAKGDMKDLSGQPLVLNDELPEDQQDIGTVKKEAAPGHAVAAAMHDKNEQKAINRWDQKAELETNVAAGVGKSLDEDKKVVIEVKGKASDGGESFLGDAHLKKAKTGDDVPKEFIPTNVTQNISIHSAVAFNMPSVASVEGTSNANQIRQQAMVNSIEELLNKIVDKAQTLSLNGQTDTTLTLKNLPLFEGATVKLTSFDSASKEFNISFNNLLPQTQKLIASAEAQAALIQSLQDKGYVVHILVVSTQPDNPIASGEANPSENRKEGRQDGGGQQQGKNQQGREQQG